MNQSARPAYPIKSSLFLAALVLIIAALVNLACERAGITLGSAEPARLNVPASSQAPGTQSAWRA